MNLILILSCLGSLLGGFLIFWLASRSNLIKDVSKLKEESENIISIAKNRAFKLGKENEKKAKQFKDNQMKKVKEEVSSIKKEAAGKVKEAEEKEVALKEMHLEITKSEARLEVNVVGQ